MGMCFLFLVLTSDGGLLAYRELDDAFGLTAMGASALGEGRRGRNIRHHLPLAGMRYDDHRTAKDARQT